MQSNWKIIRWVVAAAVILSVPWLQYPSLIGTDYDIEFSPVVRDDLVAVVTAPGTVKPVTTVEISSQLSGQISEVLVDFNEAVSKGQVLARLDSASHQTVVQQVKAELASARAKRQLAEQGVRRAGSELTSAKALRRVVAARLEGARVRGADAQRALERSRSLRAKSNLSVSALQLAEGAWLEAKAAVSEQAAQVQVQEAAIETASAALEMAKARLVTARAESTEREASLEEALIELARTDIRAPIDGVVILRDVSQGQTVAASLQAPVLFTIAQDLTSIEIEVAVDEADIGRVALGQYAIFSVDTYPGEVFRGAVRQIRKAPRRIQSVVTYDVVVRADNPGERLLPGMTALVRVAVAESSGALVIPNAALRFTPPEELHRHPEAPPEGESVWRRDGDELAAVPVRVGITDTEVTEVVDGVEADDEVATDVAVRGRYLNLLGIHFPMSAE